MCNFLRMDMQVHCGNICFCVSVYIVKCFCLGNPERYCNYGYAVHMLCTLWMCCAQEFSNIYIYICIKCIHIYIDMYCRFCCVRPGFLCKKMEDE